MKYKMVMDGATERITSTAGHIMILTNEFKEVPTILEPEARKVGAVSEEQFLAIQGQMKATAGGGSAPPAVDRKEREDLIELAINELIDEANPGNMTKAGRPKVEAVEAKTGLEDVKAKEIEDVWARITGDNF